MRRGAFAKTGSMDGVMDGVGSVSGWLDALYVPEEDTVEDSMGLDDARDWAGRLRDRARNLSRAASEEGERQAEALAKKVMALSEEADEACLKAKDAAGKWLRELGALAAKGAALKAEADKMSMEFNRRTDMKAGEDAGRRFARVAARMVANLEENVERLESAADEIGVTPGMDKAELVDHSWDASRGTIRVDLPVSEWMEVGEDYAKKRIPARFLVDPRRVLDRAVAKLRALGLRVVHADVPEAVKGLFGGFHGFDSAEMQLLVEVPRAV